MPREHLPVRITITFNVPGALLVPPSPIVPPEVPPDQVLLSYEAWIRGDGLPTRR